jgi:4-diphosphocytidyl-2-C-methyl-D-erythritol kinase
MRFLSFAKVNLHLEVLRRREDGFHELRTIFQTIDLADEIELVPARAGGQKVELEIAGAALAADESNLAWRAADRFLARWGKAGEGVRIRLRKRIPIGGGLGGGSSNAATVLLGLCALLGRNPGLAALEEVGAGLGSDVPFFLHGGTGLGTGRGERIESLPDPAAPALELWLAVPPVQVSTKEVFSAHRVAALSGAGAAAARWRPGERGGEWSGGIAALPAAWRSLLGWNDLEPTCLALYPAVRDVYNRLSESGAQAVRLSGSGSTIFAQFADRTSAEAAGEGLAGDSIWLPVKTLSREEWRRRSGLDALPGGN